MASDDPNLFAAAAQVHVTGRLIGLFSVDVGYEIDLAKARTLLATSLSPAAERRRAAPAYVGYTTPPLRASLPAISVSLGADPVATEVRAAVHDVGAVTVQLTMPLATSVASLPALTSTLTGAGPLEDAARRVLEDFRRTIAPAIVHPGAADVIEDYYVLQIDRLEPSLTIAEFVAQTRGALAAALRCEAVTLHESEIAEALRPQLSYYPDDLVVTDWNVAIVVDQDYAATIDVLEHCNVQLLELRYFDQLLDRHMTETYDVGTVRAPRWPLLTRPHQRRLEELGRIRLDVASMVERLHNAFKLGGDLFLTKVHARTAERLGLPSWEDSLHRKLDVLQQRYNVLAQRVSTARSEALEATIVLLILLEIVLALAGRL